MDLIKKQDFIELIEHKDKVCVSIFMPAHPVGREMQQDPIRLRNLLTEAQTKLEESGMRQPDAIEFLKPINELLDDEDFWQHQSEGLAIFRSSDLFRYYRLPILLDELVVVSKEFHTKPIMPLLAGDGQFYILAISMNQIRLFTGSRYTVHEIQPKDMPKNLAEILRFDDPESTLQFHTGTASPQGRGERGAMFFGQGIGTDDEKENLRRYFHKVDKGLQETIGDDQRPLVLAGVEYIISMFKNISDYPLLVEELVTGNPDEMNMKEIHSEAWNVISPHFEKDKDQALSNFLSAYGSQKDLATTELSEAVRGSYYGKVDTLFLPFNKQFWGSFDPMKNQVKLEKQPGIEEVDLLDFAAAQTIKNQGTVYFLPQEEMPDKADVAAHFRYAT